MSDGKVAIAADDWKAPKKLVPVCTQFRMLLWKNTLLKRRDYKGTLAEIIVPMCFFLILLAIRNVVPLETFEEDLWIDTMLDPMTATPMPRLNMMDPTSLFPQLSLLPCGEGSRPGPPGSGGNMINSIGIVRPDLDADGEVDKIIDFMKTTMVMSSSLLTNASGYLACVPKPTFSVTERKIVILDDLRMKKLDDFVDNKMFREFGSENEMEAYVGKSGYGYSEEQTPLLVGVVFDKVGPNWKYHFRVNNSGVGDVEKHVDVLRQGFGYRAWSETHREGYLTVQGLIDHYIVSSSRGLSPTNWSHAGKMNNVGFLPFPIPEHKSDIFADTVGGVFAIFLLLAFMWPFSRMVRCLVVEKEARISEGLKMIGVGNTTVWFSWATTYMMLFTVVSFLCMLVCGTVFPASSKVILMVWFLSFCLSLTGMASMFSAFFSNSKKAGLYGLMGLFATFLPYFAVSSADTSAVVKLISSILSPVAFSLSANNILRLEQVFIGVTPGTLNTSIDNYVFLVGVAMMLIDTVVYFFLAWYFDKVLPGEYGTSLSPLFCFMPSYWRPKNARQEDLGKNEYEMANADKFEINHSLESQIPGVRLQSLVKSFGSAKKPHIAVNKVTLDMYEGQIFVLLGHNGAGKTTTINMLTGMMDISGGYAEVAGYDVEHRMAEVRQVLGVCPQHDVLFPNVTVAEHLRIWGRLKGLMNEAELEAAVEESIEEVDLEHATNQYAGTLSGGQKRRLSLALALIGNSKVVFLDEPTSGVDPASRRSIWNLLTKKKAGRVIILTTHFMDEADQLGDRIGIMHKGELKCCGSPLFLKNRYGVGYNITLSKEVGQGEEASKKIASLITGKVAKAELMTDVGTEVSMRLPIEATKQFPALFSELDKRKKELGFTAYGLSVTTLEEVFIRVAHEGHDEEEAAESTDGKVPVDIADGKGVDMGSAALNKPSFCSQIYALLAKRFHVFKRDRAALTCQLLLPLVILVAGLSLLKIPDSPEYASIQLSVGDELFNSPFYVPYNKETKLQNQSVIPAANEFATKLKDTKITPVELEGSQLRTFSRGLLDRRLTLKESTYMAIFASQDPVNMEYYDPPQVTSVLISQGPPPIVINMTSFMPSTYLFVNYSAVHGLQTFYNAYSNALLKYSDGAAKSSIEFSIQPFSQTKQQRELFEAANGITSAIIIAIAYAFLPASYVVFVVKERESNSKHLQIISGININAYWISNYMWDFMSFAVAAVCLVGWIKIDGSDSFAKDDNFQVVAYATLMYGVSVIPFTYLCSFAFKSASTAQNVMIIVYIVAGMVMMIVSFILSILPDTRETNKTLRFFFRLFPSFCLGDTVFYLTLFSDFDFIEADSVFDLEVSGWAFIFMGWEAVVFFGLVLLIDSPVGGMLYHTIFADKMIDDFGGEIDQDVQAEIQRIKSGKAADDLIRLEGLRKTYSNKVAVNDLYFSIPRGECFGFLGVNGAGKSTTLKMLTGDAKPTRGQAYLNNLNMFEHPEEVRALTGYCPQFDALHSLLTAQETLTFYARLRGVPEKNIPEMIQRMSERLTLTQDNQHLRPCGTYSGGNKRKLSVAIALIGAPPIVFLDEPSTGMDPVSRRFMWDFISETMAGRAVILTTHSMEECEALCQRIGILVHGDLKCIGSSQHLKTRFGKGFQIQMNVEGDVKEASALINKTFDKVDLIESFAGSLKFRCEQTTGISVGQIFTALESGREAARIVDYSVGQTTLEQIFIEFARGEEHAQILEIGDGVDDEELSDSEKEEDDAAPVQRDSAGDLPGTATR